MNYKIDQYFQNVYQEAAENRKPQSVSKADLSSMLGDFQEKKSSRPPEILETKELSAYRRERYVFHYTDDRPGPVYVLTPDNGAKRHPAVLALHGHGYGSREIAGLTESGEEDEEGSGIHRHFAALLASRGFKVFAPEIIGFGDRRLDEDKRRSRPKSCYKMGAQLLSVGKTLAGLRVQEARLLLDDMAAFPDVNENGPGIMGFSGGGLIAAYTAALDERIQAAVLSGFVNTYQESLWPVEHCLDNYVPGLLSGAELPAYIGLTAPRPLFIESGSRDPLFPLEGARKAVEVLGDIYENQRAAGQLEWEPFDGAHEVRAGRCVSWLHEHLSFQ
ncbi:dienelactone hydrolase family protein [Salibacterium qingdaonense]|uniref:Alpha/beta hydrolase family protein n=1 Tax=Salibacterium qingdaonense TaxID=266892 RepID=A0A1I4HY02_9BACI|nr:alpha/beta hydrolase family protein [Salibacterium qingdaonense]SFL46697.1 Alpha/beta hydrolase family protein [Salibacterium qingdaonense]